VTKKQRNLLDDILEQVRKLAEGLGQLFDPDNQPKRAPVPVPIPVEPDRYPPRRNPYDQR
jgi:hypothetical protein